ncbi:MAG: hypothetical protein ACLP51_19335 [Syntrophobacteraceae bacterium]
MSSGANPAIFTKKEKTMMPKQVNQSFADLRNAVNNNGILDPKTTLMIHMGAAMAVGCYP